MAWILRLACLAAGLLLGAGWAAPAHAVDPDLQVLAHPQRPAFHDFDAGSTRFWRVDARVVGIGRADAVLRLSGTGALVEAGDLGMQVQVWRCRTPWSITPSTVRPHCAGGGTRVVAPGRLATWSSPPGTAAQAVWRWRLPTMTSHWQHLLVELTRPALAPGQSFAGGTAEFGVGIHVAGEEPEVQPETETNNPGPGGPTGPDWLPQTGGPLLAWAVVGGALVGVGAVLRRRR